MRKNNLKKVFAALAMSAVAVSATSVAASASDYTDAIRTGKANEAVEYNASAYKASAAYQSAEGATITPTISIDKVEVKEADAPGSTQAVKFTVKGATNGYASVGIHFVYDERLELKNITKPRGIPNDDGEEDPVGSSALTLSPSNIEDGLGFFSFMGDKNAGIDGELVTVRFVLPEDAKGGDLYPIGVEFMSNSTAEDGFGDVPRSDEGKLMQAYVFTQGIENGYISVVGEEPSSEEESSEASSEEDTTAEDTTAEDTTAEDNTDATNAEETTGAQTTAAGSTTGAAATTTAAKEDSVPTGVAGVGVAVAGLAVAVGTAFVLRKKED